MLSEETYDLEEVPCGLCGADDYDLYLNGARELYNGIDASFDVVRCRKCGFVYTNPRPTQATIGFFYPDSANYYQPKKEKLLSGRAPGKGLKHRFRSSVLANDFGYPLAAFPKWFDRLYARFRRKALLRSHLPRYVRGGRLLDIGCSWGGYLLGMRELGWDVYGIELNPRAATFARDELDLKNVRCGSFDELDFQEAFFDVIHMSMVLEHLPHPSVALRRIASMLKPGGELIISVPDIDGFEARLFREKSYTLQVPQHLSHFSPDTLKRILAEADFDAKNIVHQRTKSDFVKSAAYLPDGLKKNLLLSAPVRSVFLGPLVSLLAALGRTSRMSVYAVKRKLPA